MPSDFTGTVHHGARAFWQWVRRHPWSAVLLLLIGAAIQTFFELADELIEKELDQYDHVIRAVVLPLRTPLIENVSLVLSDIVLLPYVLILVLPFLIFLLIRRHWKTAFILAMAPLATTVLVYLLKILFHRDRPIDRIIPESGASFPSGHAAGSTVLYGILAYVCWRFLLRKGWQRVLVIILAALLIIGTGLARVFLGVHYPTDVLAGWATGTFILFGTIFILEIHPPQPDTDSDTGKPMHTIDNGENA
ncbi:MAG: phosphatase PAP2 family protein [Armatimonadota bacterium]